MSKISASLFWLYYKNTFNSSTSLRSIATILMEPHHLLTGLHTQFKWMKIHDGELVFEDEPDGRKSFLSSVFFLFYMYSLKILKCQFPFGVRVKRDWLYESRTDWYLYYWANVFVCYWAHRFLQHDMNWFCTFSYSSIVEKLFKYQ